MQASRDQRNRSTVPTRIRSGSPVPIRAAFMSHSRLTSAAIWALVAAPGSAGRGDRPQAFARPHDVGSLSAQIDGRFVATHRGGPRPGQATAVRGLRAPRGTGASGTRGHGRRYFNGAGEGPGAAPGGALSGAFRTTPAAGSDAPADGLLPDSYLGPLSAS